MHLYKRFLKEYILCSSNIPDIFGLFIVIGIITILSFSIPLISKFIIDSIILEKNIYLLHKTGLMAIGVLAFSACLGILQNNLLNKLTQKFSVRTRHKFFKHLQNMTWNFYENIRVGEMQYRMFNDTSVLAESASILPINLCISIVFLFLANLIMFATNYQIAFFINTILLINSIFYFIIQKRLERYTLSLQSKSEQTFGYTQEQMNRFKLTQLSAAFQKERKNNLINLKELANVTLQKNIFMSNSTTIIVLISGLWSIGILWIGGYSVIEKKITLGDLTAFLSMVGLIAPVTNGLIGMLIQYPAIHVSLVRFFEIMDMPTITKNNNTVSHFNIQKGKINFKNISFSYTFETKQIFNELNMMIPANSFTLIVGPNGSGKSTLLKLIGNFYKPLKGFIEIDDVDLNLYSLNTLRQQIGYVGVESSVFSGTIWENIVYGFKNKRMEDVITAAIKASLHSWIISLPEGYYTKIGIGGIKLSEGEALKISWARCFLLKPRIWLLDEATAHLDDFSAKLLLDNLIENSEQSTIIFVSHQSSILEYADVVINMRDLQHDYQDNFSD